MAFYPWSTFQDLVALRERMNRILEEALRRSHVPEDQGDREPGQWSPPCDLFETEAGVELHVELPGVRLEEVDVQATGERLVVRGVRRVPENAPSEAFLRMERTYGPFRREFVLPADTDGSTIAAELSDGVLVVRVSRSAATRARKVPIRPPSQESTGETS